MADISSIVHPEALQAYCVRVFEKMGVSPEDARITADVLIQANLRGIDSHGVARLARYVNGLRDGVMVAQPEEKVVVETPTTVTLDAGAGLGQPVSHRAMTMVIEKAREYGCGFATVRNSNHYGIAGYYAMMALEEDMIGISTTNAAVLVVPTFGRDAMYGTNPIALAVPAGEERPFVMDMATSTVPRGKLEVYHRQEKAMPLGWATDERGVPTARRGPGPGQLCPARRRRPAAPGRRRRGVQRLQGLRHGPYGRDPLGGSARRRLPDLSLSQGRRWQSTACRPGPLLSAPGASMPSGQRMTSRPTWTP